MRACDHRADAIFEDVLDIADSQEGDKIKLSDGQEVTNHDVIQRARLRVDTRKWMAGKLRPTKYGDKLDVKVDNVNPAIIFTNVSDKYNSDSTPKDKKDSK
jgi:hypothetical protein